MTTDRRMIEHSIPLAAVNAAASKEKKHPRRHAELVHPWPARRPRSACRVATAAALMSAPDDPTRGADRRKLLADLAPYECKQDALRRAREAIREDHGGRAPKVLDIFSGGGAIPLEAANLGCDAHAVELNPVAHLVELGTCVYPQRHRYELADLVERWGGRVLRAVRERVGELYPQVTITGAAKATGSMASKRRSTAQAKPLMWAASSAKLEPEPGETLAVDPIAYLWTRTVPCVNRACGGTVPLVRQTWLCQKDERVIALRMVPDATVKRARFELAVGVDEAHLGFDPAGFSDRGDATCPFCGVTIDAERVKDYGKSGLIDQQLLAMVGTLEGRQGRVYITAEHVPLPRQQALKDAIERTAEEWPGVAGILLPEDARNFWVYLYGSTTYAHLFTPRQVAALLTFSQEIRSTYARVIADGHDADLARAVVTYLAFALSKVSAYCNSLCFWHSKYQIMNPSYTRQALAMTWDFAEVCPLARVLGTYALCLDAEVDSIRGLAAVPSPVTAVRASATDLPYGDASFDAVVTDPPYYDNISYADLADFHYVWLRRVLGDLYPEHLGSEQTPKRKEATVTPYRHGGDDAKARGHYEALMTQAFSEAGRVLRPGAPLVVVYAHKTVTGWATLVDSLRGAECTVTEAWPLRTESETRLNARDTAALATSIFLVARRRTERAACDDYDELVLPEMARVIDERVLTLWAEGLQGADLVIAVIGAALAPFTRWKTVRRANGVEVGTAEYLEEAQRGALDAILKQVVRDAAGQEINTSGIDPATRLYVVARAQFRDASVDFDTFKNLAIGALPRGAELDGIKGALLHGRKAMLSKVKSKVALRGFDERGAEHDLGLPGEGRAAPLIDVLHRLLWLQKVRPSEAVEFLQASGADLRALRLVAQALGGRALRTETTSGNPRDERTAEQRAIDTLLASFQDLSRLAAGDDASPQTAFPNLGAR